MDFDEPDPYASALQRFASGEYSLDDLHRVLSHKTCFSLRVNENLHWFSLHAIPLRLPIRVTRAHLEEVLIRVRRRHLCEQALVDWATMIVINDEFVWDAEDQALTEWLNWLTLDFAPER